MLFLCGASWCWYLLPVPLLRFVFTLGSEREGEDPKPAELQLSEACLTEFVHLVLPLVEKGLLSKKQTLVNSSRRLM